MINKENCNFDVKRCKHYITGYDIIFIDDQRELRFGRYSNPMAANIDGKYHMIVKDNNEIFDYVDRDRALCFYDRDHHRWCTRISIYRMLYWQVIVPEDDIFINTIVGIAIDEIKGSTTDRSVDEITHRVKSRFAIWYDDHCHKEQFEAKRWTSTATIKVPDNFFDDNEYVRHDKKAINNAYKGLKGTLSKKYLDVPVPKFVQFNGDVTTVVWMDDTHTIVKRAEGEYYDEEKAIMYAVIKRMSGNNGCAMTRYLKCFYNHSIDISDKKKKEKKNGSNKKANTKRDNRKA